MNLENILTSKPSLKIADEVLNYLKSEVVLITGAAGSIGSELLKTLAHNCNCQLIAMDCNEFGLYTLEQQLGNNNISIEFVLGNICDKRTVEVLFQKYQPTIVYHAAAYKHVPLMEKNPYEAIKVNVIGTQIVANISKEYKVKNFVFVSTDKAVCPSSIMGATKRMGELYVANLNATANTIFKIIRFGNIPYSSGSVIPLFESQISKGVPITITDKEVTRYFISIEKVCNSLLAILIEKKGNLMLCEMGTPVNIYELAKAVLNNSDRKLNKAISFDCIGLRPGEKLHEVLNYKNEIECKSLNKLVNCFEMPKAKKNTINSIESLKNVMPTTKREIIIELFQAIIPSYKPFNV